MKLIISMILVVLFFETAIYIRQRSIEENKTRNRQEGCYDAIQHFFPLLSDEQRRQEVKFCEKVANER